MSENNVPELKVWRINDYDWYAAHSLEHAITLAMEDTGESRESVYDESYGDEPASGDIRIWKDEAQTHRMTLKEFLASNPEPGYAFGLES